MRCFAPRTSAPVQAKAASRLPVAAARRPGIDKRPQGALPAGPSAGLSLANVPIRARPAQAARPAGLPEPLKAGIERLSGFAMDDVRVHRDSPEPARLGALAYTQGRDIHLGRGQERHLPHEAWHAVQQRQGRVKATRQLKGMGVNDSSALEAEADAGAAAAAAQTVGGGRPSLTRAVPDPAARQHVIQRRDPEAKQKAPTLEESETALGTILRGPEHAAGYNLAFYDEYEPEAQKRAADFAVRERTLGFTGKKLTAGSVKVGVPIAGVFGVKEIATKMSAIVAAALARVPAAANLPPESAAAPGKIKTLAVFAHGTPEWCSLGITTSNAKALFKAIAAKLANNVTVILYTCNSARGADETESWEKGTMDAGGKGSLGELVRDTLADEKVGAATVWGHTTTGHTSRNSALRSFDARDGKGSAGQSFLSEYVFTAAEYAAASSDIVAGMAARGWTADPADAKFGAAAAAALREQYRAAYVLFNKAEKGRIAEDAPVYPYMTAARIKAYWKDVYWPAEGQDIAEDVAFALKMPGAKSRRSRKRKKAK